MGALAKIRNCGQKKNASRSHEGQRGARKRNGGGAWKAYKATPESFVEIQRVREERDCLVKKEVELAKPRTPVPNVW